MERPFEKLLPHLAECCVPIGLWWFFTCLSLAHKRASFSKSCIHSSLPLDTRCKCLSAVFQDTTLHCCAEKLHQYLKAPVLQCIYSCSAHILIEAPLLCEKKIIAVFVAPSRYTGKISITVGRHRSREHQGVQNVAKYPGS